MVIAKIFGVFSTCMRSTQLISVQFALYLNFCQIFLLSTAPEILSVDLPFFNTQIQTELSFQ